MRSSKSRSRSKQNRNRSVGNVVNRVFDSSGPEGKVRGTPQQIIEKYSQLARDAQLGNDRVATENFQQHAEHYQRMLGEAVREQDARREHVERENKERQADRDRSERQPVAQVSNTSDDMFVDDLSQSEQPDVLSMPISDDKLGLIDTPENRESESKSDPTDRPKPSSNAQTPRRRKPAKAAEPDAAKSDTKAQSGTDDGPTEEQSQATA